MLGISFELMESIYTTDGAGVEVEASSLWSAFESEYLDGNDTYSFEHQSASDHGQQPITAKITVGGDMKVIKGQRNGPVHGFMDALRKELSLAFDVVDCREHAMGHCANAVLSHTWNCA